MRSKELTVLFVNILCVKLFLTFPRMLVINSGSGAWLEMIFISVIAYILFCISMKLYRKSGIEDIAEFGKSKTAKAVTGVILFLILGINVCILMREYPEAIKEILLPEIELEWITLVFIVTVIFGAYMGLDALINLMSIIAVPTVLVMIVFLVSILGECNLSNISPIFGKGIPSILSGWKNISVFSDIILFYLLVPKFRDINEAEKSGKYSIILSGVIGLIITVVYTMIYPYPITEQSIFPVYRIVRSADIVGIFRQAESVLAFVWSILTFIVTGVYIYEMADVLKKGFSLEDRKMLIIPSGIIASSVAMSRMDITQVLEYEENMRFIGYTATFLSVIIISVIYMMRRGRSK